MAAKDANRDKSTGEAKETPRDRDQSAYSPERAHEKADRAESAQSRPDRAGNVDKPVDSRDHLKGGPSRSD